MGREEAGRGTGGKGQEEKEGKMEMGVRESRASCGPCCRPGAAPCHHDHCPCDARRPPCVPGPGARRLGAGHGHGHGAHRHCRGAASRGRPGSRPSQVMLKYCERSDWPARHLFPRALEANEGDWEFLNGKSRGVGFCHLRILDFSFGLCLPVPSICI